MIPSNKMLRLLLLCLLFNTVGYSQTLWDQQISDRLPEVLKMHREFVSLPNIAANKDDMMRNVAWVKEAFEARGFEFSLLETTTLPVVLAEFKVHPKAKTLLYYLHLDGQAVNPERWDQEDPFTPVLKEQDAAGAWNQISWDAVDSEINPEWRIFGRAAADDKAPISMLLTAIDILNATDDKPKHNIKVILDLQEEAGSEGFLSSLTTYKKRYEADYLVIFDGPAHTSNAPTLTFGCRGIARCSITTYGGKLPQHSGHYGNVVPNPVFSLSRLLSSMKDQNGKVLIKDYYSGIDFDAAILKTLDNVPDDNMKIVKDLGLVKAENVGANYQQALQYPSLNVRHIETSWKGPGLKTIIPEYATAHIDVRLVIETDGATQLQKIKSHLEQQGFYVLDRDPTDQKRLQYANIVKFTQNAGVNAFRTDINSSFGNQLSEAITNACGVQPVKIRTMGGTVPIIPAINTLGIPAVIVPLVNMDNNQHNPNENIRLGNITQGIKVYLGILTTKFK
ncbi:MAG: M20/M25/M40 family metallo-hydrolase [Gilvibacter sp.]